MKDDGVSFSDAFKILTGYDPMPWQEALYEQFVQGVFNRPLSLPTGVGKTTVIHLWLLALAKAPGRVPRRLVYVVNRRTVVDQATREAEKLREGLARIPIVRQALEKLCTTKVDSPLAISTLRGQFADNGEWCGDPSRPAIIVGTVDMIGSRLLFSGYGIGFRRKPLHAGFLGQDALIVHDEAHLEPAFQKLLDAIKREQERCKDFRSFHVMPLTATSRKDKDAEPFTLTPADYSNKTIRERVEASKTIKFHTADEDNKIVDKIAELALTRARQCPGTAILVFVRKVDDAGRIADKLGKAKTEANIEQLTGTLRGLERDNLVKTPVFQRFLPAMNRDMSVTPAAGTVFLVCTSAGEVGVDISADHLVCDLTPYDSMTQRMGRVNRYGEGDAQIDVVYAKPNEKKADKNKGDKYEPACWKTLDLLKQLPKTGDGYKASPKALGDLAIEDRESAFTPQPAILPATDILFDSWALTTIRGRLPGRPPVEPYLHGLTADPPETYVAWREEVGIITGELTDKYAPEDLLDDYPLKPHELLRDSSYRVYDKLKNLSVSDQTPVWVVSDDDSVEVATLGALNIKNKEYLNYKTVLLPPTAGGLSKGMLTSDAATADDVADQWYEDDGRLRPRRRRVWDDEAAPRGMRRIRTIDTRPDSFDDNEDDELMIRRYWHWYESPGGSDSDGSKSSSQKSTWNEHADAVTKNATAIVKHLGLPDALQNAITLAARFHDLGKKRELWQRSIGNPNPTDWYAKSGNEWKLREITVYRHEFGSLFDILNESEYQRLDEPMRDLILHLVAAHHGRARPHFAPDEAFDPNNHRTKADDLACEIPRRFARLQRKYGRWGLAYLESMLRAADYAASAHPSEVAR